MAKGKYCEFYWTTKKLKKGWIWTIRSDWKKGAKVLESSTDSGFPDERYFISERAARLSAKETIMDFYS